MRIALLKADYVNDDLLADHGDLPDMFGRFFGCSSSLGATADDVCSLISYDVRFGAFPTPGSYDVCIITGSRHSVNDDHNWIKTLIAFIQNRQAVGDKFVGFCFGHQLLAKAFGGTIGLGAIGWNVGLWPVEIRERCPWMAPKSTTFQALFNHREQVLLPPPGARILASDPRCPVQMFSLGNQVLGVQFHPEYTLAYQQAIMAVPESLSKAAFEDAKHRNATQSRGDGILRDWVTRFAALVKTPTAMRYGTENNSTPCKINPFKLGKTECQKSKP